MDIMYLNKDCLEQLLTYCTKQLISLVINDFTKYYKIVYCNDGTSSPQNFWVANDYVLKNTDVSLINKTQVIIAFINSGGTIEINREIFFDMGNPLWLMYKNNLINETELEQLNNPWFDYLQYGKEKPLLDVV